MRVIYSRYNRHRLPAFQLETRILRENGRRLVEKRALKLEARAHLADLVCHHKELAALETHPLRLPALLSADQDAARFEFVDGIRLDSLWFEAALKRDKEALIARLDEYKFLLTAGLPLASRMEITNDTSNMFAGVDFNLLAQERHFMARSFLDPIPDNLILKDGVFYFVDNEWVAGGSLPVSYVLYRGLFEFFTLKCGGFGLEAFFPFEQALDRLGISGALAAVYREMEERFQDYVCGPHKLHYAKMGYAKPVLTVARLDESLRKVTLEVWSQIQTIRAKDQYAGKLLEKEKTFSHLIESDEWEWAQKFRRILNRRCPPGSKRRAIALRLLDMLAGPPLSAQNPE